MHTHMLLYPSYHPQRCKHHYFLSPLGGWVLLMIKAGHWWIYSVVCPSEMHSLGHPHSQPSTVLWRCGIKSWSSWPHDVPSDHLIGSKSNENVVVQIVSAKVTYLTTPNPGNTCQVSGQPILEKCLKSMEMMHIGILSVCRCLPIC